MGEPSEIENFYIQIRNPHYQALLFHQKFSEKPAYETFYGGGGGIFYVQKSVLRWPLKGVLTCPRIK